MSSPPSPRRRPRPPLGNLVIATGLAVMGLSLGPISGRFVAQILSDETPSIPIGLLNPDRFG